MKNSITVLITGILLLLFVVGCDNRTISVPTDPSQVTSSEADRVLAFRYDNTQSSGDYYSIELYDTVDKQKDINDSVVEISIGDSLIPMNYYNYVPFFTGWRADDTHLISGEQVITLKIDNDVVLHVSIKPIKKANAAFPAEYDYQQPLTLNWAVESGNLYQFVKAEAWFNDVDGSNSPYSSYIKQIASYYRNHIFPANCVDLIGNPENTVFALIVQEINYKIVGKTAVMVYQEEGYGYSAGKYFRTESLARDTALRIHKQISGH